jgi:hypothetical protein
MDILIPFVARNYIKLSCDKKENICTIRYCNMRKIMLLEDDIQYHKHIKYLSLALFKSSTEIDLPDNLLYFIDHTRIGVRYDKEYNEYPLYLMYIVIKNISSFNKYLILISVRQNYIINLPPYLKYLKHSNTNIIKHFRYNDELLYLVCNSGITSWYPQYLISMHTCYISWGSKHIDNPHLYYICYMDTLTKYEEYLDRTPINRIGYWVIMDLYDVRPFNY